MTRRGFVGVAAGAAASGMALVAKGEKAMKEITLDALPYAEDALAPAISAKTTTNISILSATHLSITLMNMSPNFTKAAEQVPPPSATPSTKA